MKTLFSAALLVAATSVAANAADMSMPYKAAPVAQSVYNWTGFYLGGTAGGGIANSDHLDRDAFDGSDAGNTKFQEGFGTVGLTAGYNWQFGHTVLGIEGDYNFANVSKTQDIANDEFFGSTTRFKMDQYATLRARAGLALDQTFIYATAGLAFAHIHNTTSIAEDGPGSTPFAQADENKWKTGLAVGAGVEVALTHNWSLKGEYMLMQFQNSNAALNEFPLNGFNECGNTSPCRMNYSESVQVARIGVNYKFGN